MTSWVADVNPVCLPRWHLSLVSFVAVSLHEHQPHLHTIVFCPLQDGDEAACGIREWPYLKCVFVPAWQLAVYSHRKANDDHIRVLDVSGATAVPLDQQEYGLRVGIPCGEGDSDNYVTGMAVDYSHQVSSVKRV